jgi:hypothetical protein
MFKGMNLVKICVAALMMLVMSMSALPGVVICIGSHGHIAVEASHDNHACGDDHSHDATSEHACDTSGDCLDLTLAFDGDSINAKTGLRISIRYIAPQYLKLKIESRPMEHAALTAACVPVLSLITQRSVVLRT